MDTTPMTGSMGDQQLFLDISEEVCPLTFVRVKLLIESMKPGQTAEIRLRGAEPLANVPAAVRRLGHEVLALGAETPLGDAAGLHRLCIRKRPAE